jgi:hypothetical protein
MYVVNVSLNASYAVLWWRYNEWNLSVFITVCCKHLLAKFVWKGLQVTVFQVSETAVLRVFMQVSMLDVQ